MRAKWASARFLPRAGACVLAVLGCAVTGGTVVATPGSSPLRPAGTRGFGVSTDDRYAVFLNWGAGHIVIRDTKTGRSANYPTPCFPPGSNDFLRRGYLLLECSTREKVSYEVLRLADRAATPVNGLPEGVYLFAVGRYWVAGAKAGNPDGSGEQTIYINWHSGETRSDPGPVDVNPRRNLDDPELRLRQHGTERGDLFPVHRGRYVLDQPNGGPHARGLILRVGHTQRVLSRCRGECFFVDMLPGLVVWVNQAVVHGYALRSGQRLRWPRRGRLSQPDRALAHPSVVGTAYELYIVEYLDDPEIVHDVRYRTFVTRWRDALR